MLSRSIVAGDSDDVLVKTVRNSIVSYQWQGRRIRTANNMPTLKATASPASSSDEDNENSQGDAMSMGGTTTSHPKAKAKNPLARSPSPHQIAADLIDATCHEILLLEGQDVESLPPLTSYLSLSQRLDIYMEQLFLDPEQVDDDEEDESDDDDDDDDDSDPTPTLKNTLIRCRLLMAKMAMDVCARSSYPNVLFFDTSQIQQPNSNLKALIYMAASEWSELRQELGQLQRKLQSKGHTDPNYESLICQMEAMEALAKLRSQLSQVITDIDEDSGNQAVSHYSYLLGTYLEEYETSSATIKGELHKIHQTSFADLFVPDQMLSLKSCSTIKRMRDAVTSLSESINDMISKKVFPLQNFQIQFLQLLKGWEEYHLSLPKLFMVCYFKHPGGSASNIKAASASTRKTQSTASTSPLRRPRGRGRPRKTAKVAPPKDDNESESDNVEDEDENNSDNVELDDESELDYDQLPVVSPRKSAKARSSPKKSHASSNNNKGNHSPAKKAQSSPNHNQVHIFQGFASPRKRPRPERKGCRVGFSEEEKGALIEGVVKFGYGKWAVIREHYDDIFSANKRTNVNLKDLYRTLQMKGQIP